MRLPSVRAASCAGARSRSAARFAVSAQRSTPSGHLAREDLDRSDARPVSGKGGKFPERLTILAAVFEPALEEEMLGLGGDADGQVRGLGVENEGVFLACRRRRQTAAIRVSVNFFMGRRIPADSAGGRSGSSAKPSHSALFPLDRSEKQAIFRLIQH